MTTTPRAAIDALLDRMEPHISLTGHRKMYLTLLRDEINADHPDEVRIAIYTVVISCLNAKIGAATHDR